MSGSKAHRASTRRRATQSPGPGRNDAESPLAWLVRRKDKDGRPLLSDIEFAAGEKLRADFWFGEMTLRVTANWSLLLGGGGGQHRSPDIGPDLRDSVVAARERVARALAAVGPDLAGVLIDVCCFLKGLEASERESGWPQRSGKIVLQIALRQLARHYGMDKPQPAEHASPVRARHWGSSDYRPSIGVSSDQA
ncbi:DNA replication protein [Hyphomicrobium methylovorum]|uniref:DUF6456 domain-containing protein n=1 Tax=Hyphomicrobium methylovorum TaxID=84 RepID=UPI0015E661BB|nr:DUF6456 domain-containing protein [Hyphomicrobium methylovorum]MBA2124695.1 DNA replication protein [Hyphomicrobium methylovorum]